MKSILLPTDFSKSSINAINYAVKLFEGISCDFYILNVQKASSFISDDLMTVSSSATIYSTLVDAAKKSIANIILDIEKRSKNKNHSFHSLVDYDNFIDAINQTSKIYGIDLIVMGTNGACGLEKVIFGTNTVHVMQRCSVPVLAIPDGCKFKKLDNIGFTSSFSSDYFIDDFKVLIDIASLYKSKVQILHVVEENDFEEKLKENIDFFQTNFPQVAYDRIYSKGGDSYSDIHDYAVKNHIKMIAMVGKSHSFFSRLFARHAVETFAFKIDIPFLVLHRTQ